MSGETIGTCPNHQEYVVPTLATMVFRGAEHWCPFCGWTTGTFFDDFREQTPATTELVRRHEVYLAASQDYLVSRGTSAWEWGVKAEDLPQPESGIRRPIVRCDGCGKTAPASPDGRGGWEKPSHWYSRRDENGAQLACSRDCIDIVADRTGQTNFVLPW